jgi:hypothetical protein
MDTLHRGTLAVLGARRGPFVSDPYNFCSSLLHDTARIDDREKRRRRERRHFKEELGRQSIEAP